MNKWSELLGGLILLIGSILLAFYILPSWGQNAILVFSGGLFWLLAGLGALFILLGISDLKSS